MTMTDPRDADLNLVVQRGIETEAFGRLYTEEEFDTAQVRAWWYGWMSARNADGEEVVDC